MKRNQILQRQIYCLFFIVMLSIPGCKDGDDNGNEEQQCRCPKDTPAATLRQKDIRRQFTYNATAPFNPVGSIKAVISGPSAGQCCKPNAKFQVSIEITSDVLGQNNGNTALFFCMGGFTAQTKAADNTVINCAAPASAGCPPGGGMPAANQTVKLNTACEVQVVCRENQQCPCELEKPGPYITEIILMNRGTLQVYWEARIVADEKDCVIKEVTASILRIVDIRIQNGGPEVYDPNSQKYIPANGDIDGDGTNNQQEVVQGTDPNN